MPNNLSGFKTKSPYSSNIEEYGLLGYDKVILAGFKSP
jgi:hypothetical protein